MAVIDIMAFPIVELRKILCKLAYLAGRAEKPHGSSLEQLDSSMSRQKKVLRWAGIEGVS